MPSSHVSPSPLTRRAFAKSGAAALLAGALASPALLRAATEKKPGTRRWLGPEFWANRLQDWERRGDEIVCVRTSASLPVRTAMLLTRELPTSLGDAAVVEVSLRRHRGETGLGGLILGAGAGRLDHRAAALCHALPGAGGGLLVVVDEHGRLQVRGHDHEIGSGPVTLPLLARSAQNVSSIDSPLRLRVTLRPDDGKIALVATLAPTDGEDAPAELELLVDDPSRLAGGVGLVSSPAGENGAAFAFGVPVCSGAVAHHPERAWGPILGTLFSLHGSVLRMNVQLAPVAPHEPRTVVLQTRAESGGDWATRATASLLPGFNTLLRVADWDSTHAWRYRVVYGDVTAPVHVYEGRVPADPGSARPLAVGLLGCICHTGQPLDRDYVFERRLPREQHVGRFTPENFNFPHADLCASVAAHRPDLYVFSGDQIYEGTPTAADPSPAPVEDLLYKWFLWIWAFRELTRNTPAIVQVDDHDVYHGNLWGAGGQLAAPGEKADQTGGYKKTPAWINIAQSIQTAHNPDPHDPAPIAHGIGVYYGGLFYGGTSFAILEDRKWKSRPGPDGRLPADGDLLGPRQEEFLRVWRDRHPGHPRVVLTQTSWAGMGTRVDGSPLPDIDTNGSPKAARDRAVALVRDGGAILIAGDQHLATVARIGVTHADDGIWQGVMPAGGNFWLRWFEPAGPLAEAGPHPHTGLWTDAFGNPLRVLAVANPPVSRVEFNQRGSSSNVMPDRRLRNDGYGVLVVDHAARRFRFECWPVDASPARPGTAMFPGWPCDVAFPNTKS